MDENIRDLLRSLQADPSAREEVLRALLSDRFLELPARVDAIERTLQELVQAQFRTQQHLDALTQRVEELAAAQVKTEIAVQTLADRFAKQLPKIDSAIGYVVEQRYNNRASAYFAPIARRIRVLGVETIDDLVDDALEAGTLSRSEAMALRLTDTIASARQGDQTVHLVVEASYTVDERDVDRAVNHAGLLSRVVGPTIPILAGEYIDEDARHKAQDSGVYQVLDGTVTDPQGLVIS